MSMSFHKKAKEIEEKATADSAVRRVKNVQRVKLRQRRDHRSLTEIKASTGYKDEPTTEALAHWMAPDFHRFFMKEMRRANPDFKPSNTIQVQIIHIGKFVDALRDRGAVPRSIYRIIRKIAGTASLLQLRLKLKKPLDTWTMQALTDELVHEFEQLVYTENSQEYLLTEDIEVEELPIEEVEEGWLIKWPDGTSTRLLREDSDRVLNPRLREKLKLQAKADKPLFDASELPNFS